MDVNALKIDRTKQARRKPRGRRASWLLPVTLLLVIAGAVVVFRDSLGRVLDRYRLPQVRIEQVVLSHPATLGAVSGTAANGHIVAARRAALSADTPGRIIAMHVTEGSVVKKGDVVARLYADEYQAALERARADVVSAKAGLARADAALATASGEIVRQERSARTAVANLRRAEAERDLAKQRFERARELQRGEAGSKSVADDAEVALAAAAAAVDAATSETAVSESAVADARSRERVAKADVEVARSRIAIARASTQQAEATLAKTFVRAPFDGVVVLKDAEVGEVVSPNSTGGSNARGAVCTMVDLDSLEVQADVPETSLQKVRVGAPANIYLDAYPSRVYPGRVSRIWPTADRQQATIEVRVSFEERDESLRPEMGVRIVFEPDGAAVTAATEAAMSKKDPSILVSEAAIIEDQGKSGVFVLERDTVRFQELELGDRRAGRVTVKQGLRVGQRIVVAPPPRLASGDRVRLPR